MIRFKSRSCYPPYSSSTCIFGWFLSSEKQHLHLLRKKKIINLSVVFKSTCQEIYMLAILFGYVTEKDIDQSMSYVYY